jgi:hypothetical protein
MGDWTLAIRKRWQQPRSQRPAINLGLSSVYPAFRFFSIQQHYLRWVIPFNKSVAGQIGPLPGTIYHWWHGELKDRNYYDRYKLLENFDPYSDIQIASNGAWQWTKLNTELEEQPRANFVNRREDG